MNEPAVALVMADERCDCGNLLARRTPEGVEILCRRCKRKHLIRWLQPDDSDEKTFAELLTS